MQHVYPFMAAWISILSIHTMLHAICTYVGFFFSYLICAIGTDGWVWVCIVYLCTMHFLESLIRGTKPKCFAVKRKNI
ncbi:hypothetical protein XELAEV_18031719mg [Xenopus laevis]|uniref:Uncharacterized protein n=1 Tax=Xenopus laevis TaxID=8355 RepID=A0A974HGA8_XENLA|nr:hypothetical protein XELAEV_18031719mg [Xenopus laevis]